MWGICGAQCHYLVDVELGDDDASLGQHIEERRLGGLLVLEVRVVEAQVYGQTATGTAWRREGGRRGCGGGGARQSAKSRTVGYDVDHVDGPGGADCGHGGSRKQCKHRAWEMIVYCIFSVGCLRWRWCPRAPLVARGPARWDPGFEPSKAIATVRFGEKLYVGGAGVYPNARGGGGWDFGDEFPTLWADDGHQYSGAGDNSGVRPTPAPTRR